MVTGGGNHNHSQLQDDGEKKNPSSFSRGARPWGGTFSGGQGQSISTTSGSAGSPTMAIDNTFARLNHHDVSHVDDDAVFPGMIGSKKKKRGARAVGPDKSGRGLRQFSMKVCEKVESKGRTTYNEVADELVAEFTNPSSSLESPDQQQYDEKNIRRRVYDALNVLMAMDILSKDKKEIQWKGLPHTSPSDIEDLRAERMLLRNRIEKKAAYLQELEEQITGLQNLVQRNEQLYGSGNAPSGGVALPFILVQTRPHATVEVEISEDMQLVHLDFNSSPFELHDDAFVLKAMSFCQRQYDDALYESLANGGDGSSMLGVYPHSLPNPSRSAAAAWLITEPHIGNQYTTFLKIANGKHPMISRSFVNVSNPHHNECLQAGLKS